MGKTLIKAALALMLLAGGSAVAQDNALMNSDVSYSATRIIEAGGQRIEQRYYQQDAGKNRADSEIQGRQSTMIMRLDRNLVWMLVPQQGMYMEMSLQDPQTRQGTFDVPDNEQISEFEYVGQEAVNGIDASKYQVVSRDADGSSVEGFLWIADDSRILVKMDMGDGSGRALMELRDLQVGQQPESLFEPPSGYNKMALGGLGGMLGGMTGAMPDRSAADEAAALPSGNQADNGQPGFAEQVANEAAAEAGRTTKDEVRGTVRDNVRKGLRRIFR